MSFALVDCGGLLVRGGDVGAMLKLDEFWALNHQP